VRATAKDIDGAVCELPDANMVSINPFLFLAVYTCCCVWIAFDILFAKLLTRLA
jgi:hypothetical protein